MHRLINDVACTDDNGKNYVVYIFQEFRLTEDSAGRQEIPGSQFATLAGCTDKVHALDSELKTFMLAKNDRMLHRAFA